MKFRARFEFVQLLSVVANHSKSGFSTVNCVVSVNCVVKARKFIKCIPEILSNTDAIGVENSSEIDSVIG